jgi:hypothetical protein
MNPLPILRTAALPMFVLLLAGQAGAAPSAQLFDAVKKPEALDADWRARLCALLPQPCDPQALGLYRPRGAAAGDYAVFSSEPLAMARIKRVAAGMWQLNRLHDFSGYAAALMKKAATPGMADSRISLAPALYPLAEGRWAAAVLQTVSEMYSGGGASFSKADFVPVEEDGPRLLQRKGIQAVEALPRREQRQPSHQLRRSCEPGRSLQLAVHVAPERMAAEHARQRHYHHAPSLHRQDH